MARLHRVLRDAWTTEERFAPSTFASSGLALPFTRRPQEDDRSPRDQAPLSGIDHQGRR